MKSINVLSVLLMLITLPGCIVYPSISPIPSFHGKVVYECNCTGEDGAEHFKGEAVPNIPISIWYDLYDGQVQLYGGNRRDLRKEYDYYAFTDEEGNFSLPFLWRPYWAVRGIFNWRMLSPPYIRFVTDTYKLEIINDSRPCPYRMRQFHQKTQLQRFISSNPSPINGEVDSEKWIKFIQKVDIKNKQCQQNDAFNSDSAIAKPE